MIHAFELASPEQKAILTSWIDKTQFIPTEKIEVFTNIYNELHLKEITTAKMQGYHDKAMDHLSKLSVAPEKLTILKDISNRLMYRQS